MANEGINKLYKSFLLQLIAAIIITIGLYAGLIPIITSHGIATGLATIGVFAGVFVVGIILEITALLWARSGFKLLRAVNGSYGIGVLGNTIIIIGAVLVVVAAAILLTAGLYGTLIGLVIWVLAAILALVGIILTMVALYRIGRSNDSAVVQIGAILYLLISIVGVILLIIGLRELSRKSAIR